VLYALDDVVATVFALAGFVAVYLALTLRRGARSRASPESWPRAVGFGAVVGVTIAVSKYGVEYSWIGAAALLVSAAAVDRSRRHTGRPGRVSLRR
jgi:hypothetical protein